MDEVFLLIKFRFSLDRIERVTVSEVIIGRDPACGICLSHPTVSRKHALLQNTSGQWSIGDLNSRNGITVNGTQVQATEGLFDGTEFQIGPFGFFVCSGMRQAISLTGVDDESTRSYDAAGNDSSEQRIAKLTPAQRRVYDLLVRGLIEKEVATQLGISSHTVHDHVKAIYRLLSVSTRGELVSTRWTPKHS